MESPLLADIIVSARRRVASVEVIRGSWGSVSPTAECRVVLNPRGGASSEGGGPGAKPSAVDNVTVACSDHLVIADLPVGKSLGSVPTNAAVVKSVGRRSRRLLGERVHFCVRCDFPIAIYGRLSPCEHAFCLACARSDSSCYLCDERIQKIQTIKMLEGIYICAAPHCLKSFLKKPDFEGHIHQNHAHLLQRSNAAAIDKEGNNTELPASSSAAAGAASDSLHSKQQYQPPLPPGDSQPRQAVFSPSSNSQHTYEDKTRRYHQSSPREPPPAAGAPMPNPAFYGRHPNQPLPSEPQRSENNQYQQGFDWQPPFNPNNWFPPQHQSVDYQHGGTSGHYGRNADRFPDKHSGVLPESSPLPDYPLMHSHQQQQQPQNFPGPANMSTPGPPLMMPFGYHPPPYVVGVTQMPPSESLGTAGQGLTGGYGDSLTDTKPGGPGLQGQGRPSYYHGDYGWGPGGGKAGPDAPMGPGTAEYNDGKGMLAPMPLPFPPPHPPLSHIKQSKFSSSGAGGVDMGREGGMGYAWQNDMRGSGSGQD
ncbi:E3 ubiquitin-protein ligase HAKAI homolog [Aristolochia californica]|uniref:E3 ubiquitin-protein ligase HAKAI homolog n=1 Tax=Aristolochia californica TaxID=171875 RepID=UPI0035E0DB19